MKDKRIDFPGKEKRRMRLHTETATEFFGLNLTNDSELDTLITGDGSSAVTPRPSEDPTAEFVGLYEPDNQTVKFHDGISGAANNSINERTQKCDRSNFTDKFSKNAVDAYRNTGDETDPHGSWTGCPSDDASEVPVQDADDL